MLSIWFYKSLENITDKHLSNLQNYFDSEEPSEVSRQISDHVIGANEYRIFRVSKEVPKKFHAYKVINGRVTPQEITEMKWDSHFVYIKTNSNQILVEGADSGWVASFLSIQLFREKGKVELIDVNIKKLESDIRMRNRFTSIGTSFVEPDRTKITIRNMSGVNLDENKHTKGSADIDKKHIDILIETEMLSFGVFVYPEGKITFQGRIQEKLSVLEMFLKIWDEIKEYH